MKKKRSKFKFNKTTILISILLITSYWILFSKSFLIQNINVYQNNQLINSDEINKFRPLIINQNYFLLDEKNLLDQISKFQKQEQKMTINKKFPNTVEIYTEEANIIANVTNKEKNQNFSLMSNGKIKSQKTTKPQLLKLIIADKETLQEDSMILNKESMIYINKAYKYFRKEFNQTFRNLYIYLKAKEIRFILDNGTEIWIDMTVDYQTQINKLKNAQPILDIKNKKYEYIDLRIQSFEDTKQKIIYKEI